MPIHGSLFQEFAETTGADPFTLQNKKMLKVQMQYGPVLAKLGSMVAYQGDVGFQNTGSGGMSKMLKSKMTGEGVSMMTCEGTGELFVADMASEEVMNRVKDDFRGGVRSSVNGTPTLFLNDMRHSGALDFDTLRSALEAAARARASR